MDQKKAPSAADHMADITSLVANKTWTMGEVMEYQTFEDCF